MIIPGFKSKCLLQGIETLTGSTVEALVYEDDV